MTQILYRKDGEERLLGYIGEFIGKGVAKRYKKSDPHHMYKDFVHSYKCSLDGVKWSRPWDTHAGAIRRLGRLNGLDGESVGYYILPTPQTFNKTWRSHEEEPTTEEDKT